MEKIILENFEFLINGNEVGVALDIDEGPVFNASFLYDGGNCALLVRNKEKVFWLTEIFPEIREQILAAPDILIIEKKGDEILKSYKVDVEYFEGIPYPDDFEQKMIDTMEAIEKDIGVEAMNALAKSLGVVG